MATHQDPRIVHKNRITEKRPKTAPTAILASLSIAGTLMVSAVPVQAQTPSAPPSPWAIERVSTGFDGDDSDGESTGAAISADGTHVAFRSHATNLTPTPLPFTSGGHILVKDLLSGEVATASVTDDGTPLTYPSSAGLSGDGTVVSFQHGVSEAGRVVRRDRPGATTTVISPFTPARDPSMDASGQRTVFLRATDPTNSDRRQPIWVHDTGAATGTEPTHTQITTVVSPDHRNQAPVISGDGTTLAYAVDTTGGAWEVHVVDITDLSSVPAADVVPGARMPAVDETGRHVAYVGRDADTRRDQIRVLDRATGDDRALVTVPQGAWIAEVDLSTDGTTVGYVVEGLADGPAVWVTTVDSGRTEVVVTGVTVSSEDVLDLGADGRTVVFTSDRDDLVTGDANRSPDVFVARRTDASGPAWPAGASLAVTNVGSSFVEIGWPEAADDLGVTGYRVVVDGARVAELPATARTHVVAGLEAETTYAISVVAVDADTNASTALSGSATTSPRSTEPGTAPLLATPGPGGSVELSWDPADGATSYRVMRALPGSDELWELADLDATSTSYTDTGLMADATYRYRVDVEEGGTFRPLTVEVDATTAALDISSVTWRGRGVIGDELTITLEGAPGWQGSVDVTYETWLGEDGELLGEPRTTSTRVLAAEDMSAPGTYLASFRLTEGIARVTSITGVVSDGVGEVTATATRLPLAVRAAASVTVVAPEGSLPGARVVIDGVAQSPIEGGAVWTVAAVPAGERTVRVLAADGRELARSTVTFAAGRTADVVVTPTIPGSLAVRVLDRDGVAVAGTMVTFTDAASDDVLGAVETDALGLAVVPGDLEAGDVVGITVAPPRNLLYVETTSEATVVARGSVHDVSLAQAPGGSLTGVVRLDDDTPAVGARVVAVQSRDGISHSTTAVTDDSGRYVLHGLAGDADVFVNYRQDPTHEVGAVELADPATTLDISLEQAGTYRLQLGVLSRSVAEPEWKAMPIDARTNVVLRTKLDVAGRVQTLASGDVIVRGEPGELVRLCADGGAYGLTAGCAELVLGDDTTPELELRIESRAAVHLQLEAPGNQPVPIGGIDTSAFLFKIVDGKPQAMFAVRPAKDGSLDAALPEPGSYQLTIQGRSGDGVYVTSRTVRFDVGEGEVADLGTVRLTTSAWLDSSSIEAVRPMVAPGTSAEIRAELKPSSSGTHGSMEARFVVPAGAELLPDSVTVDGAPAEVAMDGPVAVVELGDRTFGSASDDDAVVVRARLSTDGVAPGGAMDVAVDVSSVQLGTERTQHAGIATVRVAGVTLLAPGESSSRTVQLSGQAPAGSVVTVSDRGALVGTATATPGGFWFLTATLADFGAGHEHVLVASTEVDDALLSSTEESVVVDERLPVLEHVSVGQFEDGGRMVDIDPMAGLARFPYVWRGEEATMRVDASFGGRGTVDDVEATVGTARADADHMGGGRYVADVTVRADSLGNMGLDYESIPAMATVDDIPVLDEAQVRSVVPAPFADFGDTAIEEHRDPAGNPLGATFTSPVPSLGDEAEMTTKLTFTRGVAYTPTPADVAVATRAGVPMYGSSYEVTQTGGTLVIRGTAYVPEELIGSADGTPAGLAAASAFGTVRVGYEVAFTVGTAADGLLTAATTGGKYERLQKLSDWVNANCSTANTEFLQGNLDRLGYEAMALDVLKAGIMVAGLVAAPATMGIGTVAIFAVGFLAEKLLDAAFNHHVDQFVALAEKACENDDNDHRTHYDPDFWRSPEDGGPADNSDFAAPTWIHDPSGFVFEAVPSNRLDGVTATLFHSESADGPFQPWDSEWYGQANPLVTDERGAYGWDVPEGYWQVRYTKAGYQVASSDVLEVLPPHFDVNVGLVSLAAPSVVSVEAVDTSEPAVEVTFDTYMQLDLDDRITVTDADGERVAGAVEAVDAEEGPTGTFARTFRFVPDGAAPAGEALSVTVDAMAASYAGAPMSAPWTGSVAFAAGVRGVVTGPDGQPLSGAVVMAFADTDTWVPSASTTTADDGSYRLDGLADGTYRVRFAGSADVVGEWHSDAASRWAATPVEVVGGSAGGAVDAELAAAATISGVVTGPDGLPLAGVAVKAYGAGDTWWPSTTAITAEDGSYRLTGLAAGSYHVRFDGPADVTDEWFGGFATRTASTPVEAVPGAPSEATDASLEPAALVSGVVTGPDGRPLAGVTVMAFDPSATWIASAVATTAADGSYELAGLPGGPHHLRFSGPGLVTEWHDDARTRRAATPVTVRTGQVVVVGAVLASA